MKSRVNKMLKTKIFVIAIILLLTIFLVLKWMIPAYYKNDIIEKYPKMPTADRFCGINGNSVQKVKMITPFPLFKNPYMVEVAYGYIDENKSDSILCNGALVMQVSKINKPSKEKYNPFIFSDSTKISVEDILFDGQLITIDFIEMIPDDGIYYLSASFEKFGYWFHLSTFNLNLETNKLDRTKVLEEVYHLIQLIQQ